MSSKNDVDVEKTDSLKTNNTQKNLLSEDKSLSKNEFSGNQSKYVLEVLESDNESNKSSDVDSVLESLSQVSVETNKKVKTSIKKEPKSYSDSDSDKTDKSFKTKKRKYIKITNNSPSDKEDKSAKSSKLSSFSESKKKRLKSLKLRIKILIIAPKRPSPHQQCSIVKNQMIKIN